MPKFNFLARDASGKSIRGSEEALNADELIGRLQTKDLIVVSITQEGAGEAGQETIAPRSLKHRRYRITGSDLVLFCRQLATLLAAGVTILKSLDIISKQVPSAKFYQVIVDLAKNMEQGLSLHAAMAKHPRVFSELWVNLVESGEASGNLAIILDRLASYLERNAEFRKKIISSLTYPAILFFVGLGALLFLTLKIIPTFNELFKNFNIRMPLLTQILINTSYFIRRYVLLILIIGVGLFYFLKNYLRTKSGRWRYEQIKFKLPVLGEFFRAVVIERFSSELSTLIESGVPILYSLEITEQSVGNLVMAEIIRKIKESVRAGRPLSQPLEQSPFFEPMVIQMVRIGEEVGELSPMLKRINLYYQSYVEHFLARLTALFEPIMLMFMGVVIGLMVIGMFLPIFQITRIGG